jgi:hypothetical protein
MPILVTKPPANLVFISLAELHEQFHVLFIGKQFQCPRGIPVVITPHHFFHLVKLQKGSQTQFTVEVEVPLIRDIKEGFGEYAIDMSRAQRLSWIPEILREPHEIWEPQKKKKADEVVLREYDKAGTSFRAVLLLREGDSLKLITCMPMPRRAVIGLRSTGRKLWP